MTIDPRTPIPITPQNRQALLDVAKAIRADLQRRDCDRLAGGFMEHGLLLFREEIRDPLLRQKWFALLEAVSAHINPDNWKQYAAKYPAPASPVTLGLGHLVLDSLELPQALILSPDFVPTLPASFYLD